MEVLQAVNRQGSARVIDISKDTGIPYPTVCRIIDTLVELGMLEREEGRRYYRPAALVQTLSIGYQDDDALVEAAIPLITDLGRDIGWPVTITTRVGANMMVRASTHLHTTLTYFNYFRGYTLPLLHCSVGKVYLAFCDKAERETIISMLLKYDDDDPTVQLLLREQDQFLRPFRDKGFAYHVNVRHTKNPGKTSSLGVPIFVDGKLKAAMGLVYFSSAMSVEEAAGKYVDKMKATAEACSRKVAESKSVPTAEIIQ